MPKLPWHEITLALVALVGLGVAWAVARGLVDDSYAAVVNASAAAAVAIVVAVAAVGRRKRSRVETSAPALEGELRLGLIDKIRVRWIGTRDEAGRLRGSAKLAQDLASGRYVDVRAYQDGGVPASRVGSSQMAATTIDEAWIHSGHAMALTGKAGSGKSVQLLTLAERLLDLATKNDRVGVPVIVPLSDCKLPKRSARSPSDDEPSAFEDWLVHQLNNLYRLPTSGCYRWLISGDLIPIIDGLDEIGASERQAVFEALAVWVRHPSRPPAAWVLGCRYDEFSELDPTHKRLGSQDAYWTIRDLVDEDRVRFLESDDDEQSRSAWRPVILAISSGQARHLTEDERGNRGVLSTPLGLTVAVEAYAPTEVDNQASPAQLLEASGAWDRLWARYVLRQHLSAQSARHQADAAGSDYPLVAAQRWLGNLASGKLGPRRTIDMDFLAVPNRPIIWRNVFDYIEYLDWVPFLIRASALIWAVGLFIFGGLVGWQEWDGVVGVLLAVVIGVGCAIAISILNQEFDLFFATVLGALGFFGSVLIAGGLDWPGARLAEQIQPLLSGMDGFGVVINDRTFQIDEIRLGEAAAGALTGLIVGVSLALGLVLIFGLCFLVVSVRMFGLREPGGGLRKPIQLVARNLGWLFHIGDSFYHFLSRDVILRWWHLGAPLKTGAPVNLLPHPEEWDAFLNWAAQRGYLRRVGFQYVWMHETLRIWFQRYQDEPGIATLRTPGRDSTADERRPPPHSI